MRLFLKIFLWFLLAITLTSVVMTFITRTLQTEPLFSRWQRSSRSQLGFYGATAAQVYNNEGEPGLKLFLMRLDDVGAIQDVWVTDGQGRVIYGDQSRARDFGSIVNRSMDSDGPEIDVNSGDAAIGAVPVTFADGRHLMLVVTWDPPRTPSLFFDSWLGYMRLVGFLVTGLLLCFALAAYLSSPIAKIRAATNKLASGDLHTRLSDRLGRRRDELGDLARDFDVMADRIESLVTSQQRLSRDVSHELRSPLARMNVALEIAKKKSNEETRPILQRIENEAFRLNEMISRILTLSKLESGSDDFERARINLSDVVQDVAEDAAFEAEAKGKVVRVTTADDCRVMGNEVLIRSAIDNVLRNAVRYTAEGTSVDVSLRSRDGKAVVTISDHGGGVPEAELDNLFRPFYRVSESRERTTGGIGLGLAIARQAVRAHKGTISAANRNGGLAVEIALKCEG